ncbi:MAG TPA: hypothetical protein GX713_03045 [Mollicutes bacterium]|nr:hypothetical protein [Mollicutes bacterium]
MKIGIDIDDTITQTYQTTLKYLKEYYPGFHIEKEEDISDKKTFEFLVNHIEDIQSSAELKPGVKEAMDTLKEMGFEIIIITARGGELDYDHARITEDYLKKHKLPYDKIYYGDINKGDAALKENIDFFIDDRIYNLDDVSVHGVDSLHFVDDLSIYSPYKKFDNWKDIIKYIKSKVVEK